MTESRPIGDLRTEAGNPRAQDLDTLTTRELVALTFQEDTAAQAACAAVSDEVAELADRVVSSLRQGGRLVYVGAGTSGRMGVIDAVELGPTFGVEPSQVTAIMAGGERAVSQAQEGTEDDRGAGYREVVALGVGENDAVVGLSASGRTRFTEGALDAAGSRDAFTALITCNPPQPSVVADQIIVLDTGPEVLAGSTRMKAGTATKMVLNALSLAVMTQLGKVYGNRMVDLRTGSRKLRDRALRLVCELGEVPPNRASLLLGAAGGHVKTAIVMARTGLDLVEARQRLQVYGGFLRQALVDDAM
jgi:N-acetylmuramic acid 6-phosphate etherase